MIVQESGERKSETYASFMSVIDEYEKELIDKYRLKLSSIRSDNAVVKEVIAKKKRKIDPDAPKLNPEKEALKKLASQIQPEPEEPILVLSNATDEEIILTLSENGGAIGIASPEGGMTAALFNGQYRKQGEIAATSILNGAVGDDITYRRKGSSKHERIRLKVYNPAVSGLLFLQWEAFLSAMVK